MFGRWSWINNLESQKYEEQEKKRGNQTPDWT